MGLCVIAVSHAALAEPTDSIRVERHARFNEGWRFIKGDPNGAERQGFDDANWQQVRLPHDWAIEGPFDRDLNPHTAALRYFGTAWYRKTFELPETAKGLTVAVEFDGVMSNSQVWINGRPVGGRPYGYIGFQIDLTPYLVFGDHPNVLAVRVSPEDNSSRWYPGAGIYRNVWIEFASPSHVAHWGTYVTTPSVSDLEATVSVNTIVANQSEKQTSAMLHSVILDGNGTLVTEDNSDLTISAESIASKPASLRILHPHRWDLQDPYLYTLVSEVSVDGKVVDTYRTPIGVRTIAFDKDKGLFLNGRHLKLHGVCMHHDLGALGTAVNRRAIERQLEILKAAGVNAIRTSHNPPTPELLELTDRMGFLVIDEAFDMWRVPKLTNDYSKYFDAWSERDVRDMARRDRNHPSIILWSIGNEIPDQEDPQGAAVARRLTRFFHEEDPTRPTTANFNEWQMAIKNKLADEVDIPGFDYWPEHYGPILREHPNWIIVASETESCVSSRGVYHLPIEKYKKHPSLQLTSYDIIGPSWAYCPDVEYAYQEQFPQVLGEFVWTGFDYLGEPTPFFWSGEDFDLKAPDWPARSSYFGMVDLAGFPKDRYYLYQSEWTDKPMVHLLPHWNWEGKEGQTIPVMVYSNADEVELFLNGHSLGQKARYSDLWEMPVSKEVIPEGKFVTKYRRIWQVPYQPGSLKAIGYAHGKQVAVDEVRTAGLPALLRLIPDRASITGNGVDLSFVTVRVEDKDGNLCPLADNLIHFDLSGDGEIAGVDNGNAATVESFRADHRKAFNGLALLIVRSKKVGDGTIRINASSDGLTSAAATITTRREPMESPRNEGKGD